MNPLDLIRAYLAAEPARLINYGTVVVVAAATQIGRLLGYEQLPDGITVALGALVAAVLTEAIRRFVYSENSVRVIAAEAAAAERNR